MSKYQTWDGKPLRAGEIVYQSGSKEALYWDGNRWKKAKRADTPKGNGEGIISRRASEIKPEPLPPPPVPSIPSDISGKVPSTHSDISGKVTVPEKSYTLEEVVAAYRRWLHLPDASALYAVLATYAANTLPGDPLWLVLVGPPGDGKTEIIRSLVTLEHVHMAGTLTEASLLSGTSKKERAAHAKGGLLKEIGSHGVILAKDLGSILSMQRDARAAVLAALREVYDGSWTRHVGTDGGQTLSWSGKVGLIAGCTPAIDRHHAVIAAMGERFLMLRHPRVDAEKQARRALSHMGREVELRKELAGAVRGLFTYPLPEPRSLTEEERDRLVSLTTLVVRARSSVDRDGYSREIEMIPPAEAPTRLIKVLDRLLAGLDAIGLERSEAWKVVGRAALDSIPAIRRRTLKALLDANGSQPTNVVAATVDLPTATARRSLEDLAAHRLVSRSSNGHGKADSWELTDWTATRFIAALATVPEKSDTLEKGQRP